MRKEAIFSHEEFQRQPSHIEFESVSIQWEKGKWEFENDSGEIIEKETYSIWNSNHWKEIASRLAGGETCAMYVAGCYGVGKIFESPEWIGHGDEYADSRAMFEEIKKRPYKQNFVAFIHPEDQINIVDIDRLPEKHKNLRWAYNREKVYSWAQHNIYPARQNALINKALLRMDVDENGEELPAELRSPEHNSIACFWIRGHWGFEGISNEVRKMRKHGLFGGGSLNFHKENPGFKTSELYQQMQQSPSWLEHIDFVIFDELSEAAEIYRSQSMVSFVRENPTLLRQGSLTADQIHEMTGIPIVESESLTKAASVTEYTGENNVRIFQNIQKVMGQIQRAGQSLKALR